MSWGPELWDQYDSIVSHTQKGIDFLEKYGQFVDHRCKIEQEYASKLRRLVTTYTPKKKNDEDDYEFTCMKEYRNALNELGCQAGQHEVIAENLNTSIVLELASLVKQLKEDRRKQIIERARIREQLQSSFSTQNKTKDKYEKAFGASERALDLYRKADADLNLSRAEVEKHRLNSTIKSQQYDDSKAEYASQLQKTNQAQTKYYTEESPSVFQNFQDLDEKRIKWIKNFILKSVEIEREVVPIISQCLNDMEKSAESINEKEDSRLVVEKYKSGFKHPGDIPFHDLDCSSQSALQTTDGDREDRTSANVSVKGSKSQDPASTPTSAMSHLDTNRNSIVGTIRSRSFRKGSGIFQFRLFSNNKDVFSHLPPNQRRKKLQAKIEEFAGKISKETGARNGLMKMKQVYESNPALGDPMSIQGQLSHNVQQLDKLRAEQNKFQDYLDDMEGRPVNSSPNSQNSSRLSVKRSSLGASSATEVKGNTGGVYRRSSVPDGAFDFSVFNPEGLSQLNNEHNTNMGYGNDGAMGNVSTNSSTIGFLSITDNRIKNDQLDLREDLSSEQGGIVSDSGSSRSASFYRDATSSNIDIGPKVELDGDEFNDSEPLTILGRCKALYPTEVTDEGTIRMDEGEEFWIIETDEGNGWTKVRRINSSTLEPMSEGFVPSSYIETCELSSTPCLV
jgi:hypothetical protein